MATAVYFDIQLIAQDPIHAKKVQAAVYRYANVTIGGNGDTALANHGARKNYASQVLNNYNVYASGWNWTAAQDANLANAVVTANTTNFPTTTTAGSATVTTAVEAVADSLYDNIASTYWNLMANA